MATAALQAEPEEDLRPEVPLPEDAGGPEGVAVSARLPLDPERALVATSWQTFIHQRPDFSSPRIGYLRSGTVVRRAVEPAGFERCAKGFYEIEPRGFVCVGKAASLDVSQPLATIDRRAKVEQPLPYAYAVSGKVPPELYTRVPDEPPRQPGAASFGGLPLGDVPAFLDGGQPSLRSNGDRMSPLQLVAETAVSRSSFAFVELFAAGGRGYGLTTDLLLVSLDRVQPVKPSEFHGVALGADDGLPVAFVLDRRAALFSGSPRLGLRRERALHYREAVRLSGERRRFAGGVFLETRDGKWLLDGDLVVKLEPRSRAPRWATPGRPWLDVSLGKQTLVAYVGTEPVYATLVSTGRGGTGDPVETQATVQGEFLIHTKHVTNTMSSDEEGDVYDHRDVPYVQFFKDGYALHAAHWHDDFGKPKSHGCINLSPEDARWLFEWSDPLVPDGWHGAMSLRDGTLISIHP